MKKLLLIALLLIPTAALSQTIPHTGTLNWFDLSCTTASACAPVQQYRAKCASATSCPDFNTSPTSFIALPTANVSGVYSVTSTVTATGTTWNTLDMDPALLDGTTYEWVARAAYIATPSALSGASIPFQGATLQGIQAPSCQGCSAR